MAILLTFIVIVKGCFPLKIPWPELSDEVPVMIVIVYRKTLSLIREREHFLEIFKILVDEIIDRFLSIGWVPMS